jgi:hypothetical protein
VNWERKNVTLWGFHAWASEDSNLNTNDLALSDAGALSGMNAMRFGSPENVVSNHLSAFTVNSLGRWRITVQGLWVIVHPRALTRWAFSSGSPTGPRKNNSKLTVCYSTKPSVLRNACATRGPQFSLTVRRPRSPRAPTD